MATGQHGASDAASRRTVVGRHFPSPQLPTRRPRLSLAQSVAEYGCTLNLPVASLHLPGSSPTRQSAESKAGLPASSAALPARTPPDPQRPGPCPAGTPPTTTPTVDRGWLRRHPPRAVAVVASWRRPGVPGPPPSWPRRQPTAPQQRYFLVRRRTVLAGPTTGQCPFAVPYGRPGQSPPGPGVRFPQFRNAGSGHWLTPRSLFLLKSDDILTNPFD